jgi:predicted 3-demethylubiquinone-9 3-methyltransferase (glyoxalase superfamily)/uncharacterized protein YndB with AHSA1/START domain
MHWFAPKPFQLIVHQMDFRTGGRFRMAMRDPDGHDFPFGGRYPEIVPPRMLSWTGEFSGGPADQISTVVHFSESGRKTKVRVRQAFHFMTPEAKHAARGAKQGWTATLDQLAAFCARTAVQREDERRQKIMPCLWFNDQAEAAARFYVSVFRDSRILGIARYGKAGAKASGKPQGSVMTVSLRLAGQDFLALNGGPQFAFSPAISLVVNCGTQQEVDDLWSRLSADPDAEQCGWLKDKFGVSWQIVPAGLERMMRDPDARRSERVMAALVRMKKLDLAALQAAGAAD